MDLLIENSYFKSELSLLADLHDTKIASEQVLLMSVC